MSQIDIDLMNTDNGTDFSMIQKYFLGSILIGGNGAPDNEGNLQPGYSTNYSLATMENWRKMMNNMNEEPLVIGKYLISLLSGTDAVHGN